MKTPDEIKKWLEYCHSSKPCIDCKYDQRDFPHCVRSLLADAINGYEKLVSRLAQVERERDAAVHDLPIGIDCDTCKYSERAYEEQPCSGCKEYRGPWYPLHWEWRGVCEENTKDGAE